MSDTTKLGFQGLAPSVKIIKTQIRPVPCPYLADKLGSSCSGHANVTAELVDDQMQIVDFKKPHQCNVCKRWFDLGYQIQVYGKKREGE